MIPYTRLRSLILAVLLGVVPLSAQGLFRSAADLSSLLPGNGASHFEATGDTLWFGTNKGITRSVDGGATWETFADRNFPHPGVAAMSILGGGIWAGTVYDENQSQQTVQVGGGFSVSNDNGSTWIHLPQVSDDPADSIIAYGINDSVRILPVIVPQQNIAWGVALAPGAVWVASWAAGLRTSTDKGAHWRRILLPLDNRNSIRPTDSLWTYAAADTQHTRRIFQEYDPRNDNNLLGFSVFIDDSNTVWCGTAGGINKSTDGGLSWTKFSHQNQSNPILGNWIIAIREQHVYGKHRIWTTNWKAVDQSEEFGVSYTDDGGATWKNFLQGIRAYDFAFRDSIVYVATDRGLYHSIDDGATWQRSGTISDPASGLQIATPAVHTVRVVGTTVWIGTPDGVASTVDDIDHPFGSAWKVYRAYSEIGAAIASYAYPNPFSPAQEPTRIHYSTGGKSETVTIEIFDFGMNRVRTVVRNAERSGTQDHEELWNGLTDSSVRVANGVYHYRISFGDGQKTWGKILVLQ